MARLVVALAATVAAYAPLRPAGLRALPSSLRASNVGIASDLKANLKANADWRSACEKGVVSYYDFGVRLGDAVPASSEGNVGVDVTAAYLNSLAANPSRISAARPSISAVLQAQIDPVAETKRRLLEACDAFEATQRKAAVDAELAAAAAVLAAPKKRWYQRKNALKAESYASEETKTDPVASAQKDAVIALLTKLAKASPPTAPLDGWMGRNGVAPKVCGLDGRWKLRFTNAADARFRSDAETSQDILAATGLFVNCVDFTGEGKLRGFRVEVDGEALNDTEVQLAFRRVRLLRRSRFPRLFGTITIPLPNPKRLRRLTKFLSRGRGNEGSRGAGFELLYLDDGLRAHRTFDGLYFVQTRL